MTPERLTEALRERSRQEGLDACVVAAADRLERDGAALVDWLDRERQAGMAWMKRDPAVRADPRELLPGCRSVDVVARNYWPGE